MWVVVVIAVAVVVAAATPLTLLSRKEEFFFLLFQREKTSVRTTQRFERCQRCHRREWYWQFFRSRWHRNRWRKEERDDVFFLFLLLRSQVRPPGMRNSETCLITLTADSKVGPPPSPTPYSPDVFHSSFTMTSSRTSRTFSIGKTSRTKSQPPRRAPKRQRRFTPRKEQSVLHHSFETRKRFENRRASFRVERQVAKWRRSGRLIRKFTSTRSVPSKLAVSILRRSRSKRVTTLT